MLLVFFVDGTVLIGVLPNPVADGTGISRRIMKFGLETNWKVHWDDSGEAWKHGAHAKLHNQQMVEHVLKALVTEL